MEKHEITFEQAFDIINGKLGSFKTDVVDRSLFWVDDEEISKASSEKLKEMLNIDFHKVAKFYDKRNQPPQVVTLKKVYYYKDEEYYVLATETDDILCGKELENAKCFIINSGGEACVQITTSDNTKSWSGGIRFYPSYQTVIETLC